MIAINPMCANGFSILFLLGDWPMATFGALPVSWAQQAGRNRRPWPFFWVMLAPIAGIVFSTLNGDREPAPTRENVGPRLFPRKDLP